MSALFAEHHPDCICAGCERARIAADQAIARAQQRADQEIAMRGLPGKRTGRPNFTSTVGKIPDRWITENVSDLFDWYDATIGANPDDESWPIFCAEQFFQQQTLESLTREWAS